MGIILIFIGIIIQIALYKSNIDNASEDFLESSSLFMINPIVRIVLTILSLGLGLIIGGIIRLFS
jgi:hypothetical protein